MKTEKQKAGAAAEFAKRWEGRGYEKGDSQPFWFAFRMQKQLYCYPKGFIRK